jgi:hypothetical protein
MSKKDDKPEFGKDKIKALRRARGGRQYNAQKAGAHEVKRKVLINREREKELDEEIDEYLEEIESEICPVTHAPHDYSNLFPYRCEHCKALGPEPNAEDADIDNLDVMLKEDLLEK